MSDAPLPAFLARHGEVVRAGMTRVRGSSPREAGAEIYVSADATCGTIGGGQLEYMVIDEARALLASGGTTAMMDVPLGPEIGQCCGGRVEIALVRLDAPARLRAADRDADQRAARPEVLILGAGHVGRELAHGFARLPVRAALIDGRAAELDLCDADIDKRLTPLPEAEIRRAGPGSAFIVLTHDHALDFLLTAEALARCDAGYVGLIGSATKRAGFESYCRAANEGVATDRLICPIGAAGRGDKRPEVIAAFVVAEVMGILCPAPADDATHRRRSSTAG